MFDVDWKSVVIPFPFCFPSHDHINLWLYIVFNAFYQQCNFCHIGNMSHAWVIIIMTGEMVTNKNYEKMLK